MVNTIQQGINTEEILQYGELTTKYLNEGQYIINDTEQVPALITSLTSFCKAQSGENITQLTRVGRRLN